MAVNCGHPSPPSDGFLEPYTSTVEGAMVNRVHVCQNGQLSQTEQIICISDGQWKIINGSTCASNPGTRGIHHIAVLIIIFSLILTNSL